MPVGRVPRGRFGHFAAMGKVTRRLVEQGGVEANGEKVADVAQSYTAADFQGDGLMLKKGKKVFHRVQM